MASTLNLDKLTVTETELPQRKRASAYKHNPFETHVAESYESGTGRAVTVPGPATQTNKRATLWMGTTFAR